MQKSASEADIALFVWRIDWCVMSDISKQFLGNV